jgi:hypothetical protein
MWTVPVLLVAHFNTATIISGQFKALLGYTLRNKSQEQPFAIMLHAEYSVLHSGPLLYICQFEYPLV